MRTSPSLSSRASGMSPPDSALAPHAGSSQRRARHRRHQRRRRRVAGAELASVAINIGSTVRYTVAGVVAIHATHRFATVEVQSSGSGRCRVPDPFHPEIQCAEGVNTRTGTERRGGAVRNVQVTRSGPLCSERSVYLASLDCGVRCEEKAECTMQLSTHHPSST